ncbi:MAG: hypothetical protein CMP11_06955 [Zetaproteobacteria bacterium]|nr:hypothetical protein [Pseudobdellovibrionaceae bacterium]|tara:strand:- start:1144 stop:1533 length:390 start_codon:yes stop_codon:yes gene_type:complete
MENLCDKSDQAYHFSLVLTLNQERAKNCLNEAYELLTDNISTIVRENKPKLAIYRYCWEAFQTVEEEKKDLDSLQIYFKDLVPEERALLFAVDFWGINYPIASKIIGINSQDGLLALAKSRKHLSTLNN